MVLYCCAAIIPTQIPLSYTDYLKFLVTTTCQLSSLDQNVITSHKTFHASEKCLHFIRSKVRHAFYNFDFFNIFVMDISEILETKRVLHIENAFPCLRWFHFFIDSINNEQSDYRISRVLLVTLPSPVLNSGYDTSTYIVFSILYLFQNQLPDWHLLELPCFSKSHVINLTKQIDININLI